MAPRKRTLIRRLDPQFLSSSTRPTTLQIPLTRGSILEQVTIACSGATGNSGSIWVSMTLGGRVKKGWIRRDSDFPRKTLILQRPFQTPDNEDMNLSIDALNYTGNTEQLNIVYLSTEKK